MNYSNFQVFYFHRIDLALPNSMPADDALVISVNIYFSYKKKIKEEFLFFRIRDRLAILGRLDKQLTVNTFKSSKNAIQFILVFSTI